ncbi:FAD-dependent oxidoreductase [Helicobacter canis]|uniref:Oxidoreductase domain-containing protein n=1 Tax=Helicobacter canis TaxID=29419 RepID=A0A377J4V6_9HELI|nr:FAD-dependent oxidoreductase [Helicobacter canis]STO97501.1 oxidoreductase domain-containing protein [Helicobacter canis]
MQPRQQSHNFNKALLIGSGYFGQILRPYIAKHCEILAIANTSTSDLPALLRQADLCFIATPLHSHFELARAALQAHCHTFIEKPATSNAQEYSELVSLATAHSRVLFTDYIYTLSPSIRHALLLCQGLPLESICATITQYGKFYENESVLEVLGVHYLSVFALMQELGIIADVEVQECVFLDQKKLSARLRLCAKQAERSIPISLECSLLSHKRQRVLRLFGKKSCLQVNMLDPAPLSYVDSSPDHALESSLPIFDEGDNLAHSLATFMSFIASDNLAKDMHYVAHTNICERTACLLDSALLKKHRLMPNASLVLGSHSADFGDCHTWQSKAYNESKKADSRESHSANAKSMDCHATASAFARNDSKNAASKKVDSSTEANLNEPAKDSRICDEKSGFCERVQGRILGVCNRSTREAIHDLSRKAESTKKAVSAKKAATHYDCIIIGGGFFGAYIASSMSRTHKKLLLIEKERDLLLRASVHNQARVHNGYHYPRSLSTALSSARHFARFCDEFAPAIDSSFEKYYAIAKYGSKTSATQFYRLFKQFSIPIEPASDMARSLCDNALIEDVFCVQEYAFNANILRQILQESLRKNRVQIALNTQALRVFSDQGEVGVSVLESSVQREQIFHAPLVLNCTYAGINALLHRSNLPPFPLKYELTEMALVRPPESLSKISFTIMDGAFFSLMPYPARDCYTLSHVRYTPHCAWSGTTSTELGNADPYALLDSLLHPSPTTTYKLESKFPLMRHDAMRYIPSLSKLQYIDSLYEIKTLRTHNEIDDGRPIIFAKDYGIPGFCTIMGGKIDNIYEIIACLHKHF